jgi:hypothetical protein
MEHIAPQDQSDSAAIPVASTRDEEHSNSLHTRSSVDAHNAQTNLPSSIINSTLSEPLLSDVVCAATLQARIAELEVSLEHREREIHAMRRTSEALFQHNSVDSMVRQTLNTALEVLGAEAGSLQLYDAQEDSLVFRYVVGPATERLTGYSMPASQGIADKCFALACPTSLNTPTNAPASTPTSTKSAVTTPSR